MPTGALSVSCPSVSLCVAVDGDMNILTSVNPAGGQAAWAVGPFDPSGELDYISCPSSSLCVATGSSGSCCSAVETSTNPSGGATTWKVTASFGSNVPYLADVACPSVSLCVAGAEGGNVVSSSNPTGSASAWHVTHLRGIAPTLDPLISVACASASVCLAVEDANAYVSRNPTGDSTAWTSATVDKYTARRPLLDISCAAPLCAAIDDRGDIFTSTRPVARRWKGVYVHRHLAAISCPSASLCVAVANGSVLTSTKPAGGRQAWKVAHIDQGGLSAVSCPSIHFCVAGDNGGNLLTSSNPTGGRNAWRHIGLPSNGDSPGALSGFSCAGESLCVGVDMSTGEGFFDDIFTSTKPAGGSNDWQLTREFTNNSFTAVSCPSRSLCVATGGGQIVTSRKPTRSASWHAIHLTRIAEAAFNTVACPSTSLCIVGDSSGSVATSSHPAGGSSQWTSASIDPEGSINSLSCPSTKLCVAVDDRGRVLVGKRR